MLSEDGDDVLREYFAWSEVNNPADVYYPHCDPVRRLRGSSVRSLMISDEEAAHVDRALCRLKGHAPEVHKIIMLYYQQHRSVRWMESRGMGDRRSLSRRLAEGRQFITGFVSCAVA